MIKYTLFLVNFIGLMTYRLFFAGEVSVTATMPTEMKLNEEYVAEVSITKGSVNGFAKLSFELPEGLVASATPAELKGATFTYSNNQAKIIWTSLPGENNFKITFKVKPSTGITNGSKSVSGKFAYVDATSNERQTVTVSTITINIKEAASAPPEVAQQQPVKIEEAKPAESPKIEEPKQTITETSLPAKTESTAPIASETAKQTETTASSGAVVGGISCSREVPTEASGEFIVKLTINKGALTSFAKLQENVPKGFTAEKIETNGATFTFVDDIAKFVWLSLPSQNELKVSYKIIPTASSIGEQKVEGKFSYIENDETKTYNIPVSAITIKTPDATIAQTPQQTEPAKTEVAKTEVAKTEPVKTEPTKTEPVKEPVKEPVTNPVTAENIKKEVPITDPATNVPSPNTSVNYRIQIMALHKTIDVGFFKQTYNLSEKVDIDMHEGWNKYLVGGFNEYKDGRDHREEVRGKGVAGPFVTAYNNGKRITVQEALMITKQKWYK